MVEGRGGVVESRRGVVEGRGVDRAEGGGRAKGGRGLEAQCGAENPPELGTHLGQNLPLREHVPVCEEEKNHYYQNNNKMLTN